jgi:ribonuclease HI
VTDPPERLPAETLSPLATHVDEALALYDYELEPTVAAIDDAVADRGGLFDPRTTDDERRAAIETVLAGGPPARDPPGSALSELVLYVDGSSRGNPGPAGAGAVLLTDETELVSLGRPVGSHAGNNVAEYAALQLGLDAAVGRFDATALEVRIDSRTVIDDVWGGADNATPAARYRRAIDAHLAALDSHGWTHLADHEPNPADACATVGADIAALGP